ncbi:MAG: cytochrome C oxidase Cbb3, partial [Flavobacteriaceae bacterium]|nr:cytochrome C oxidase Cbb3 [Flavobacteriaceae bacterium]
MKIKINWGTGIVIAMLMFMTFILTFVYKSLTQEYTHELVSEDYYKDE